MHAIDVAVAVAMTLLSVGILLTMAHLVAWVLVVARHGEDAEPLLLPWGYIGVGLFVAFLGFYLTRGVRRDHGVGSPTPRAWC